MQVPHWALPGAHANLGARQAKTAALLAGSVEGRIPRVRIGFR